MLRLFIVAGLLIGFAGTPAMGCPDNLDSGGGCTTELDTNPGGAPDNDSPSGDRDTRESTEDEGGGEGGGEEA